MKRLLSFLLILLATTGAALAQSRLKGRVVDAKTGEQLPFTVVTTPDGKVSRTDVEGRFDLPFRAGRQRFSVIGYETKTITLNRAADSLIVRLTSMDSQLGTANVTGHRTRYSRKNNPAVELMRKVIAAKGENDLKRHDYYTIDKYSRTMMALNEVTDKVFQEDHFKRMPFLKDHVEVCNETGKLILPLTVTEQASELLWRKEPRTEKQIVTGDRTEGITQLFSTGGLLTTILKDAFADVDLYQDKTVLMHNSFLSPIADHGAIAFYRYFIIDTLEVSGERCIQLDFTPNNPRDIGYSGSLYVTADSTYRIRKIDIGIPVKSGINFVESMRLIQNFNRLPSGEQVMTGDDMIVELKLTNFITKAMVRRTTTYSGFDFDPISDSDLDFTGPVKVERRAAKRGDAFWAARRPDQLSKGEASMGTFIEQLERMKGFKPVIWFVKAFVENFIETSTDPARPSKVDIGPINTMLTSNTVDGFRMRASAQTTAAFNPHLFLKGYLAYGFKDQRVKGMGEVTYSFNEKKFLPRDFPVNNLTFTYTRDVMSPSDKFLQTDKDNVFVSLKWKSVNHMMYYETYRLLWDREWESNLRLNLRASTSKDEPTASLFYQPLSTGEVSADPLRHIATLRTYDLTASLTYMPGAKWIVTKQRRTTANDDAPVYSLSHTAGGYVLGGKHYPYNVTEAKLYRRFWLASWGRIEATLKGGVQWNKVPYPLLIMPAANLSYIVQQESFRLMDNMEFPTDRYASLILNWDLNGKIFNRIPLLNRLGLREHIGCNVLWGTLTDKNNPYKREGDARLFHFPGEFAADGTFSPLSHVMDPKKPYVEVTAGLYNIFKILHIEYVRRLTYLYDDTQRWGIRFMVRVTF